VREFGFELSLCARLEAEREAIVARQLGAGVEQPGGRVLDTVVVEPGPEFEERAAIAAEELPRIAIEADVGAGRFRRVTAAVDARPDRARAVAERAAEAGFWELDRRRGHLCARQVARYPERWFDELLGIENKPDLGTPGELEDQLRTDASLGVVDRAVLATESFVTGAHLNRIPEAVGVWRYSPERDDLEVVREPAALPVDRHGVELLERHPGRDEIAVVSPEAKARARRRIAERAYGKGWRTFALPGCAEATAGERDGASVPYCEWKGRIVDPAGECGPGCPGFEAAEAPAAEPAAERDARTPWIADPDGRQRSQSGLDRFG